VSRLVVKDAKSRAEIGAKHQVLYTGLSDGIGIAVDVKGNQMWATDIRGGLYVSDMDGKGKKKIGSDLGMLTGIDYAE